MPMHVSTGIWRKVQDSGGLFNCQHILIEKQNIDPVGKGWKVLLESSARCRESVLSSALESLENEGAPIELAQARGKLALISNPRRDVLRTSAHVPPSRGCRPHAVYAASNLVEAIEVEVARRIRQFGLRLAPSRFGRTQGWAFHRRADEKPTCDGSQGSLFADGAFASPTTPQRQRGSLLKRENDVPSACVSGICYDMSTKAMPNAEDFP